MIELKVGDRVSIYGCIEHLGFVPTSPFNGEVGTIVTLAHGRNIALKLTDSDDVFMAHRKQVRKLVKVKKCDECDGLGKVIIAKTPFFDLHIMIERTQEIYCPKCNGKGKVKV